MLGSTLLRRAAAAARRSSPLRGAAPDARLRVAVLLGGDSSEREISLLSGAGVAAALRERGHDVVEFDPAVMPLVELAGLSCDVAFIALHGGAGEDGRVQRQLEGIGLPYTGSGARASQLAMSKSASKCRFAERGVPTLPWAEFRTHETLGAITEQLAPLGLPLACKPDRQGSSLGVSCVREPHELPAAVAECFRYDPLGLAEPWIAGRELTVAVLGRTALPTLEIVSPGGWFNYEAKYRSATTEYHFDPDLPRGLARRVSHVAMAAADALGTAGLVRVDLMLDVSGRPWVLEVNTVPGLTPRSLAPKAAEHWGLPFAELCDRLVRSALTAERKGIV